MAFVLDKKEKWSERGLSLTIWATIVAVFLGLADGVFKGPLSIKYGMGDLHNAGGWYKRAGKTLSSAPLESEWEEIARALAQ